MVHYKEQLNRVRRYFYRFEKINNGMLHSSNTEYYIDEIYAFFQNCYHLKDWLKNDPNYKSHQGPEIEDYIYKCEDSLQLCADICNGIKHLKRKQEYIKSKEQPEFGAKKVTLRFIEGSSDNIYTQTISLRLHIKYLDRKLDAFDLAKKSLNAWEVFIQD